MRCFLPLLRPLWRVALFWVVGLLLALGNSACRPAASPEGSAPALPPPYRLNSDEGAAALAELRLPVHFPGREPLPDLPQLLEKASVVHVRYQQDDPAIEALRYFVEAVGRMTGRKVVPYAVEEWRGAVTFATLEAAPEAVRTRSEVQSALASEGEEGNEAFYVSASEEGILFIANFPEGLNHGVVELLESVGYEVLAMGPNWTHAPDHRGKPLDFAFEGKGRPGFLIRMLGVTSGQTAGLGTLGRRSLPDPNDETVEVSYNRWATGTRTVGASTPLLPGHRMQLYHKAVAEKARALKSDEGFLAPPGTELVEAGGKYFAKGQEDKHSLKLDVSIPWVREIVLEDLKKSAEAYFERREKERWATGSVFVFGTDPEDGIRQWDVDQTRYPNWFPEYLAAEGVAFGKPYRLHGFAGIDQPNEVWTPHWFSDTVFALNEWLLREADRWLASLPEAQQRLSTGEWKRDLIRISLLSYNFHDVPPGFNLDRRQRVKVAGYPKHRGRGKWRGLVTHADVARAFRQLLPGEPSSDYWIMSIASHRDFELSGIGGSRRAESVHRNVVQRHAAGFRTLTTEVDLNFGKMGLEYYLCAKMFWNPQLSTEELAAIRTRWFQRSFGSGWEEMARYYDLMSPESGRIQSANLWAEAIRLMAAADAKIPRDREPAAARRLDDLKVFWYYYYLRSAGKDRPDSPEMREFYWKGQMSYAIPMFMVGQRIFKQPRVWQALDESLTNGPAHYTAEETARWWAEVQAHWPWTPVQHFAERTLVNGRKGSEVDLHDLVAVAEFQSPGKRLGNPAFVYDSASRGALTFLTTAAKEGEEIGFRMRWPDRSGDAAFGPRGVAYGIRRWMAEEQRWEDLVDEAMVRAISEPVTTEGAAWHLAEGRFAAPEPGSYSVYVANGGNAAQLGSLRTRFPGEEGLATAERGVTLAGGIRGASQGGCWLYLPKGTLSLDLEIWGGRTKRTAIFHRGLPGSGLEATREVDLSNPGVHTLPLEAGEAGSFVRIEGGWAGLPFAYSVPNYYAFSPEALLVPRQVAEADGLTIQN